MGWDMYPMTNGAWLSKGHGKYEGLLCVASSIRIFGWAVRSSVRDRCASGGGEANMARAVLTIAPIRPRRNAQEVVTIGGSGNMVGGVVDVASGGSGASDRYDP